MLPRHGAGEVPAEPLSMRCVPHNPARCLAAHTQETTVARRMESGPTQLDLDRFRRLVALGLIYRRSDGALVAHSDLQRVPKRLVESWDRPWTPADDAEVQRHCRAGASISAMADCMRRKRHQIVARLAAHGPPPAYPWTDAARRLVIGNSRTWRQAAQALGRPREEVQRIGSRLGSLPDAALPVVRVVPVRQPPIPRSGKAPRDPARQIQIGTQRADGATAEAVHIFGQLLRRGHVALCDGVLQVDQRLLRKPRVRARQDQNGVQPYAERIRDRDQGIIAAAQANVPMEKIARQACMTRWGATLVLRRHGFDFTRMEDLPDTQERRKAVQAAMRTAPSLAALAQQVGLSLGKAAYSVRQIDPNWIARRVQSSLAVRRRQRHERIQRLRMALICRRMSMSQVGRAAGVKRAQPAQILIYGPNEQTAGPLARVLRVPMEWLMEGAGSNPAGISASVAHRLAQQGSSQQRSIQQARRRRCEAALRRWLPRGLTPTRIARQLGFRPDFVRACARRLRDTA